MKGLRFYDKILFALNSIAAFLLLCSYLLPFVSPKDFSVLSVLSLAVPLLIVLNLVFLLYWLLKVKRQLLLSLIALLVGFNHVFSLYKFTSSKDVQDPENFTVMNYNVRLFNLFEWLPSKTVETDIAQFIKNEQPDVLCLQEYHKGTGFHLNGYEVYEQLSTSKVKSGQAIYSKFPIINSGSVTFPNTSNNAIYVDIIKDSDTIRIYNLHLQSNKINPEVSELTKETSENLLKRVGKTFKMQQE